MFNLVGGATASMGDTLEAGVVKVMAHAVVGCISGAMGQQGCGAGAASAAFGKLMTVAIQPTSMEGGLALAALSGAVGAKLSGSKPGEGAFMAALGYLFNELMSRGSTSARQRQIDAGYGESDDVYQARLRRAQNSRSFNDERATPEQRQQALGVLEIGGRVADTIAVGAAGAGILPVAAGAALTGKAIDFLKFGISGDYWALGIDLIAPAASSVLPKSVLPGWNGIREMFGVTVKETAQDAYQSSKGN
jgi:hypothetical protein